MRDSLLRIEMEPALAARSLGARVPGDAKRLEATAGELDQVLLQRLDAEGVLDLVVRELAVRTVGGDVVLAFALGEGRRDAGVGQFRIGEVTEDGALVRFLHRAIVVRSAPGRALFRVAGLAALAADVSRRLRGRLGLCRGRRHGVAPAL